MKIGIVLYQLLKEVESFTELGKALAAKGWSSFYNLQSTQS